MKERVKFKIDAAQTMISTLSKMLSRRISQENPSNKRVLNEVM